MRFLRRLAIGALAVFVARGDILAAPIEARHQDGITTPVPAQAYTTFIAFDLTTEKRADVQALLRSWTEAAQRLTNGEPVGSLDQDASEPPADSGAALDLPPSRLTLTFGFGPGLFVKNGKDRYGLAKKRPEALAELPHFPGDQLVEARTGGDLSIQACSDDPQVTLHAIHELARLTYGTATIRWVQSGFLPKNKEGQTPRNLMGFKDGTMNPSANDAQTMDKFVWVGKEGPAWMRGGSYVVFRQIRIAVEHWNHMKRGFQEQTVGRYKYSGAPLGQKNEKNPLPLDAYDKDGNPVVPENAHARLASPEANGGAQILRRPYSYDNGANLTAERWPPWRQGMEFDSGLLFIAYQRDPRTGFVKIFTQMAKFDMLNQFTTHVGSALFACPPGAAPGKYIGQQLFD